MRALRMRTLARYAWPAAALCAVGLADSPARPAELLHVRAGTAGDRLLTDGQLAVLVLR